MGSGHYPCAHLVGLVEPEDFRAEDEPYVSESVGRGHALLPYAHRGSTFFQLRLRSTFWGSSSRPDPTVSDFAIATSHGTDLIAESQSRWSFGRTQTFRTQDFRARAEVLSVDWLDRNTILNGCRDGTVTLWDARTHGSDGTSSPVKHPSCINHVRKLDANRMVVAGLERQMATYDLRYLRPTDDPTNDFTRPYVEFPGYGNNELNGAAVGFDVRENLVAAGTDGRGVQLFDGPSGREVMMGGMGGDMGRKFEGPARCLQFSEMEHKGNGLKLFVGGVKGVEQWTW